MLEIVALWIGEALLLACALVGLLLLGTLATEPAHWLWSRFWRNIHDMELGAYFAVFWWRCKRDNAGIMANQARLADRGRAENAEGILHQQPGAPQKPADPRKVARLAAVQASLHPKP